MQAAPLSSEGRQLWDRGQMCMAPCLKTEAAWPMGLGDSHTSAGAPHVHDPCLHRLAGALEAPAQ